MRKDAFSIIIPAYKTERLLKKLLNELLRQREEFPQTQIIVVDDGSEMAWLDEYPIVTIHQENKGEAGARNTGLRHADGEYLAWVDADDMVVSDYLKTIYENARKGYDLVIYDWVTQNGTKGYKWEPDFPNHNVWSYTYRRENITEEFDERIQYSCDIYWLKKQFRPEWTRLTVDKVIVIYNDRNDDSMTARYRRGELNVWK